jgi:putative flippase GtrA
MNLEQLFEFGLKFTPPFLRPLARKLGVDFIRFGLVGAFGFTVDLIVLQFVVGHAGFTAQALGPVVVTPQMQARFISFPVAVAATWALNRAWTFKGGSGRKLHHEAAAYLAVQFSGGAANLAAYNLALALWPALAARLFIPLALGSAVGLCLTFVGSKYWAFKKPA